MTAVPQTSAFLWGDRYFPPAAVAQQAKALQDSGVVDFMSQSTQLGSFITPQLWRAENAPVAALLRDPDSLQDAFLMTAYSHAAAPELGISLLTDGLRIGPAQLTQMLLTLAQIAEGRMVVHVGGGEVKQTGPFGYQRSRGIKSLADFAQIFEKFCTSGGPFDFAGNHWTMTQAFLGSARPHRPRIHAMGSGPMLIDVATSYCDGLSSAAPCAWGTPEEAAEAGVSFVAPADCLPVVCDPEDAAQGLRRSTACLAAVKGAASSDPDGSRA